MLTFGRPRFPQVGNLQVDANHTLARGLHDCVVFNVAGQHGLVNLAGQRLGVTLGQNGGVALPSWNATIDGVGLTTVATSSVNGGQILVANQGSITAGDCAFRVRFVVNALPGFAGFATVLSKNAPSRELGLFYSDSTGIIGQINLGAQISSPGGNAFTTKVVQDVVVTKAGGTGALYQNGVATVTGMAMTGTASATSAIFLGNDNNVGGNAADISFLQMQTWTRNLSAAEVLQMYLDPFCFLTSVQMAAAQMFSSPPLVIPLMGQIWI